MKKAKLICICGEETEVSMVGNNNADGKALCNCGRNITIHLRRNGSRLTKRAVDASNGTPIDPQCPVCGDVYRQCGCDY